MRSAPVVPFVIAVVALAARLPLYLAARPLWLDEALLAENVVDPVRGLFDPLVNLQTAPIGFLLPVQLLVRGMGYGELVLRFLPLLAGLATVAMVWLAARRFAGDSAAAYAAGLAAVSPLLIRYSNELKPYAFDALLAACAIWLSLWAVEELTWARWRRVIAAGSVIVFSSVPGIFLAWGVALAALFANTADRSDRLRFVVIALVAWTAEFLVLYFLFYSPDRAELLDIHLPYVGFGAPFVRAVRAFLSASLVGHSAEVVMPPGTVGLLGLTTVAGLAALWTRAPRSLLSVTAPLIALAAAYVLRQWPLTTRVLLWCLPSVLLLVAVACDEVRRRLPARLPPWLRAAVPLLVLLPAGYNATVTALDPPRREDVAGVVAALAARPKEADGAPDVYVAAHAEPTCRYYSPGTPDRWVCEIPGYRIVKGEWMPLPMRRPTLLSWAEEESALIDRELADGGWLVLAGSAAARRAILGAVESRGFRRLETLAFEGAELVRIAR